MSSARHTRRKETKYICLETRRCQACWKCLDACSQQVLGKIEIGWHRHVRIRNASACRGCKKCVRVCEAGALTYVYVPHTHSSPAGPFDENGEVVRPCSPSCAAGAWPPVERKSTHETGK
jgi:2-oxoglutarate ferredoxin oxidoreductase subunit delta